MYVRVIACNLIGAIVCAGGAFIAGLSFVQCIGVSIAVIGIGIASAGDRIL